MKIKKIKNKLISLIFDKKSAMLIILVLFFVWIVGSLVFYKTINYSALKYDYVNQLNDDLTLYKNKKLAGEFQSKDNYLGIVSIKFNDFIKPNYADEDILRFRIKEKGENDWYYLNNYRSGVLKGNLRFPFGFPPIPNSKDKSYIFEIESISGNEKNAVTIDKQNKFLSSGHQYPKEKIFGSNKNLIYFIIIKTHNLVTSLDFILSSVFFALPLIFYLLWVFLISKTDKRNRVFLVSVLTLLLIDIFLINSFYLGIYLGIFVGWNISIRLYRLESSVSFLIAFLAIIIWIFLVYLKIDVYTDKLNIWSYSLLFIGSIQALIELKYKRKNLIDYKKFITYIIK